MLQHSPTLGRLQLLLLLLLVTSGVDGTCGGYKEQVGAGSEFSVTSPNFPGEYPRNQRCVWLFSAKAGTALIVTVSSVQLQGTGNNSTGCSDYLRITEGSSTARELAYLCSVSSTRVYNTSSLYLWILFRSDHQQQGTGFQLLVTAVQDSTAASNSTPVAGCTSPQFTCPNKECIDKGCICDNVNDCGCDDYGCDETLCWKFAVLNDVGFNWGVGVSAGVLVGLLLLIVCGIMELPERKKPECLKRHRRHEVCLPTCQSNRVEQQSPEDAFRIMLERMTQGRHPLRWDADETDSDATRSASRRTSMSGSQAGSRRSSTYQMAASTSSYGATLSPGNALKLSAAPAAAAAAPSASASSAKSDAPGPITLAVPSASAV